MKYLGIDWATQEHVASLVGPDGHEIATWRVAHMWSGVRALLEQLMDEGGPDGVLVGIEPGAPSLTAALMSSGYTVYEINPKQADRFRDRYSPAGAKDDRRDAYVLANAVRTDASWLRPAAAASELDEELWLRCRDRLALVALRRRTIQQLAQALGESHPAVLALGMKLSSPFVLDLLQTYPDAVCAARSQRRRLDALLRRHRIRKYDVESLRAVLREKGLPLTDGARRAYTDKVRWLVQMLHGLNASLDECEQAIADLFAEHPDREILTSVPGTGKHLSPHVVAELAVGVGRSPPPPVLQAIGGTCPITKRSGKQAHGVVTMRRQCNRKLQSALFQIARCSLAGSPWARAFYDHQRARGVRHNAAVRALSNKWAKILATLLARRQTYDETRHLEDLRRASVPWAPPAQGEAA